MVKVTRKKSRLALAGRQQGLIGVVCRRVLMSLEYVKEFFLKYIQGKKKSKKEEHNLKQYRVN